MFEGLTRKPFKDRLKDTGFLLKNSFTIIGKSKDIKAPTIHIIALSILITTFIFASLFSFFLGKFVIIGVLLLLFTIFILIPFRFFYEVRQKADQCWIVYNALAGKEISYSDAHAHTKNEKGKLTLIAFIDMLIKYAGNQRGQKKGILGVIINIFLIALVEIWDLLSHYMLPAVVIEEKPLKEMVPELKALKNNVPATLMGVFGIDFAGDVIKTLFNSIKILLLIISVGIGYLISLKTQTTVITLFGFSFSWVPVLIMMYIIFLISGIFTKLVESVKVIYFTIFYTSVTRPMIIIGSMRDELTHYLLMQQSDFASQPIPTPQTQYINQLADYIKQYESKGYSEQEIKKFLVSKSYSEKDINSAINKTR